MILLSMFISLLENEIAGFDESQVKFFQYEGVNNAYINYNGRCYRVRVEMLVFNSEGQVYVEKRNKPDTAGIMYKLPGGSVEPNKSFMSQAIREVQEEAHINTTSVKYTGIHYITEFNVNNAPKWLKDKMAKFPVKYEGTMNFVYVGKYKSKYTGHIDKEAMDDLYKKADFYDVEDIEFREEHLNAIRMYR